jgi:L-ribulose-5-phosphate 4-epimerase
MIEELKEEVFKANLELVKYNLVTLTWGNVSGILREKGLIVIKPSGVDYETMKSEDMVVLDMEGRVIEGPLSPSSDTPTHLELYKAFPQIGGITHSHSRYATMFAQASKDIPCFGTTHADHFYGPVPVTRFLTEEEVVNNYELNTGILIVERFKDLDPVSTPAVIVSGHGPFTWGKSASESVKNNVVLEQVAEMTLGTMQLNPGLKPLPDYIKDKHYQRKHGPDAYYGQE